MAAVTNSPKPAERVAILDCGGQYTKVIDRRVRELGVYTDIFPLGVAPEQLEGYGALILSGGPSSVWESGAPAYSPEIFAGGRPILGICYGMQLLVEHFGGTVRPEVKTEYGQIEITVDPTCPLFYGLDERQPVLMSHGDAVTVNPDGFEVVGRTGTVTAAIWSPSRNIAGVQFHPEVDPTVNGVAMLENFLRRICSFRDTYALEDRIETSVRMIRERVKDDKPVIVLVSGGVDSAVTAALLVKALPPEQVYAIHIDHGLMRKNESDVICASLSELGLVNMRRINAEDEFFNEKIDVGGHIAGPLRETCDPEEKRAIIGSMFIKVTREVADELDFDFDHTFLAQGTLRPDLIESGNPDVSGYAHKIKTHHNDVDIVRRAREKGLVIETNWDWHKDEVRRVARMLGLPEEVASRQPFPGPGLGVRLICSDGNEAPIDKEKSDALAVLMKDHPDYTAVIAPLRSVGVQGDNRSYKNLVVLATKVKNYEAAASLAKEIPNKLPFVNRVVISLTGTSTGGLECGTLHVCRESAEILREADAIVTDAIMNPKISQCFAVLTPLHTTGSAKKYSVAIRAVVTGDFMTARPAMPGVDFDADKLSAAADMIKAVLPEVDCVYYDLTGKPPATVEWE